DATVLSFEPGDFTAFYAAHYTDSALTAGFAGAISRSDARAFLDSLTARLPRGRSAPITPPSSARQGLDLTLIAMPAPGPGAMIIGAPLTVARGDSGFATVAAAAAYLGRHGGVLSELLDNRRGLSYAAWVYPEHVTPYVESDLLPAGLPRRAQYFSAVALPTPPNTGFVLNVILAELEDVAARRVEDSKWRATLQFLEEAYTNENLSPVMRMHRLLDDRRAGRDGWFDQFRTQFEGVNAKPLSRELAAEFRPADCTIVAVVPQPQAVREQLMRNQLRYTYPEGYDARELRGDDYKYISYQPLWDPPHMRVVRASDLFR
ncbi:MAG TPA: insulinase family protein, partial [candidate division Zixibacteria bacterium]|nr:insulinase family protein [candidate division Zixibacteria bacterium]